MASMDSAMERYLEERTQTHYEEQCLYPVFLRSLGVDVILDINAHGYNYTHQQQTKDSSM